MYNDREMMVNVKPGEYTRRGVFLQSVTQAAWKKKTRVLPIEIKPVTF